MKHKLFPVVLSCALTFSLLAKADTVTSKVVFGNGSKNCAGMGICKTETTSASNSAENVTTSFTWDAGTSKLTMRLPVSSFEETPAAVMSNLNAGKFVVEEAFALSREMISGLKAPQGIKIAAGTYVAKKQSDGSIVVDFGSFNL